MRVLVRSNGRNITQLMQCIPPPYLHIHMKRSDSNIQRLYILESTVGPMNKTHQLWNIMQPIVVR